MTSSEVSQPDPPVPAPKVPSDPEFQWWRPQFLLSYVGVFLSLVAGTASLSYVFGLSALTILTVGSSIVFLATCGLVLLALIGKVEMKEIYKERLFKVCIYELAISMSFAASSAILSYVRKDLNPIASAAQACESTLDKMINDLSHAKQVEDLAQGLSNHREACVILFERVDEASGD